MGLLQLLIFHEEEGEGGREGGREEKD